MSDTWAPMYPNGKHSKVEVCHTCLLAGCLDLNCLGFNGLIKLGLNDSIVGRVQKSAQMPGSLRYPKQLPLDLRVGIAAMVLGTLEVDRSTRFLWMNSSRSHMVGRWPSSNPQTKKRKTSTNHLPGAGRGSIG